MRDEPLASVVVNNYNYGRFVGRAIDSALGQTYPKVEVVVVDDGSTDNSREVISGYGDRIVALLKENGGQASACNAGFDVSRGEVVLFLDSDDVLLPSAVRRAVDEFRANAGAAKVQYKLQIVDAEGGISGGVVPRRSYRGPFEDDMLRYVLKFHSYPRAPMSGNVFRRAMLRRILPMPEDLYRSGADLYLNDLSVMFGPTIFLEEVGAHYRVHGSNVYASVRSMDDPAPFRRALLRFADVRARQRELFETLHYIEVREVGAWDLFFLKDRMIHLKLAPENHPFREGLASLCARGCVSAAVYPGLRPEKRVLYALWFLATAVAPKPLAAPLVRRMLNPYAANERTVGGLIGRLRGSWRRVAPSGARSE